MMAKNANLHKAKDAKNVLFYLKKVRYKMSNKNNTNGISFCGLLTIVFISLKLCGVINWSWIWVLAPIWISLVIAIIIAIIINL